MPLQVIYKMIEQAIITKNLIILGVCKDYYFIMSNLNEDSSSLLIVEQQEQIEISEAESDRGGEELFDLSRDDPTLSFRIEQEKRQLGVLEIAEVQSQFSSKIAQSPEALAENKKRRKDIFQKFKKPQTSIASKFDNLPVQDNLLNIFDSIFKTSSNTSKPEPNITSTSKFDFLKPCQQPEPRSRTPSAQRNKRLKIFGKKSAPKDFEAILPSDLVENISQTQEKNKAIDSPVAQNRSINFSMIQKRGSGQFNQLSLQFSNEQMELKNILQSQIFVDQPQKIPQIATQKLKKIPNLQIPQQLPIQNPIKTPKSQQQKAQIILPLLIQSPIQLLNSGILQQSKVIRSDTSIISTSPALHGYIDNGNGFQPQNSMANLTSPIMFDLSMKSSQANENRWGKFGKNQLYESQVIEVKPIVVKMNYFDSQKRIPIFLREIRKHVSIYPNFYLLSNPHTTQSIKQQFSQLLNLFTKAITILNSYCQRVLDLKAKKKIYLSQLSNSLTVDFFVESGWEKILDISQYNQIRPMQPFQAREWSFQKAKMALANYQNIVQYYKNKGVVLDVGTDQGKKKYFEIRQKFWDICGNMKLISEDIYTQMIDCLMPQHFYRLRNFLKQQFPTRLDQKSTNQIKQIACLYKTLKIENDIIIASDIGIKIKENIDDYMKYLNPY